MDRAERAVTLSLQPSPLVQSRPAYRFDSSRFSFSIPHPFNCPTTHSRQFHAFFRPVPRLPSSPPRTNFLPLYPFHSFLWLSAPYQDKKKIITASILFPLKSFLSYSLIFLTILCLIFYCISRLIILRNFFIFS